MRVPQVAGRRSPGILLSVAVASVGLGLFAPARASSCDGPSLEVPGAPAGPAATDFWGRETPTVRLGIGRPVTVTGTRYYDDCEPTGPGGCTWYGDSVEPLRDVELELSQGDRTWLLGSADARETENYAVTWEVRIPADARQGPATLRTGGVEVALVLD